MKSDIKNLRIFPSAPLYKDAMVQIAAKSVRHNSQKLRGEQHYQQQHADTTSVTIAQLITRGYVNRSFSNFNTSCIP